MDSENENTQNNTKTPDLGQKTPDKNGFINGISKIQIGAIILKTEGKTYNEISEIIGLSVNTLKGWFRRGNLVYGAYKRYSKDVVYEISVDATHRMRLQTEKAVDTIIELLDKKYSPAIRLSASKYILDRDMPFTEKERADRADFGSRFESMLKVMEVSLETLAEKSEAGEQAREKFKMFMDRLDEMESWT